VLAPAPGLRLADLALLTGATAGTADSATAVLERLPAPRRLRLRAADDPLFRLFASGEYGDPVGGSFRARWSWPGASLPAGGSVLIEFEDGVPGLVRYRGSGTVFVWALPLTPECSDFAARVEFVPLLAELLLGCRDAGAGDRPGTAAYCGEPLAFDLPEGVTAVDIGLSDAAGTVLPTRLQDGPGVTRVVATEALSPGLYTWQRAETALARAAVNFPPVESDLRLQSAVALAGDGTTMLRAGADLRRLRDGVPLWPWLLAATLALALLEGVALQWVERTP
jgi:hypothetical protein